MHITIAPFIFQYFYYNIYHNIVSTWNFIFCESAVEHRLYQCHQTPSRDKRETTIPSRYASSPTLHLHTCVYIIIRNKSWIWHLTRVNATSNAGGWLPSVTASDGFSITIIFLYIYIQGYIYVVYMGRCVPCAKEYTNLYSLSLGNCLLVLLFFWNSFFFFQAFFIWN